MNIILLFKPENVETAAKLNGNPGKLTSPSEIVY